MSTLLSFFFLFLPFQFALQPIAGFDVASLRLVSLLLVCVWLVRAFVRRQLIVPAHPTTFFLLNWLVLVVLSLGVASHVDVGLRKLLFLLSFLPLFWVFADFFTQKPQLVHRTLTFLMYSVSVAAGIALIQWILPFVIGIDPTIRFLTQQIWPFFLGASLADMVAQYPSFLVNIGGHTLFRAVGLFPDPHIAASVFEMVFPCALALALTQSSRRFHLFALAALIFLADLLTFSRGSYAGLLLVGSFGLLFVAYRFADRLSRRTALGMLLALPLFLIALAVSPVGTRLISSFSATDTSNQGRFAVWHRAGQAFSEHPWLGVGLGNFPFFVQPSVEYRTPIYAHNLFLDTLAESGIFGGLFLALTLLSAGVALFHRAQQNPLFFGPFFGLIAFLGHAFFETSLFSVHVFPILLLFLSLSVLPYSTRLHTTSV